MNNKLNLKLTTNNPKILLEKLSYLKNGEELTNKQLELLEKIKYNLTLITNKNSLLKNKKIKKDINHLIKSFNYYSEQSLLVKEKLEKNFTNSLNETKINLNIDSENIKAGDTYTFNYLDSKGNNKTIKLEINKDDIERINKAKNNI